MDKPEKERILEELGGISESEYDAFVRELIAQTESQAIELKAALEGDKFDGIAKIAHSIKGSSGNLRIYKIQELAKSLELAAKEKNKNVTADKNIKRLSNLLIDIDTERIEGVSSTDEEHDLGLKKAEKVRRYLFEQGWTEPLCGDSGNGAHLIYKIDMDNIDENVELVKNFLVALASKYDDTQSKVDLK